MCMHELNIYLPQRKNKRRERMESAIKNKDANNNNFAVDETDEVEIRPIRRRDAVEAGLDYWIDDGDFEREKQRRIAVRNRKVRLMMDWSRQLLILFLLSLFSCLILAFTHRPVYFSPSLYEYEQKGNGGYNFKRKTARRGRSTIQTKLDRIFLNDDCDFGHNSYKISGGH